MPEKSEAEQPVKAVAPGYPAVESLREVDVTDWEPAVIFQPIVLSEPETGNAR